METQSHGRLVINSLKKFGRKEWEEAGSPRAFATPSTGTDHVDAGFFERSGVEVYSLTDDREALTEIRASSEFTFMAILMGLRRVDRLIGSTDRREPGHELYEKQVGIIGLGRIGKNIASWCRAFGASYSYHDPYVMNWGVTLPHLFSSSDIVCITCSLTDETTHMIDRRLLESMKENAVLVNTSRGAVINEADLIDVMRLRPDLTAVLDVLEGELDGRAHESPLYFMKNVIVTPHVAGHTVESIAKANAIAERLLYTNQDGKPE